MVLQVEGFRNRPVKLGGKTGGTIAYVPRLYVNPQPPVQPLNAAVDQVCFAYRITALIGRTSSSPLATLPGQFRGYRVQLVCISAEAIRRKESRYFERKRPVIPMRHGEMQRRLSSAVCPQRVELPQTERFSPPFREGQSLTF
jgi:hypothetical protein